MSRKIQYASLNFSTFQIRFNHYPALLLCNACLTTKAFNEANFNEYFQNFAAARPSGERLGSFLSYIEKHNIFIQNYRGYVCVV